MKQNDTLFTSGKYFTGCNYWASHAGTNMWRDWRPDVIDEDMAKLAEHNVRVMRMFPNWRDFQPLRIHYGGGSSEREIRLGEAPLPFTDAGRAGVDIVMADRFAAFCDLAEKHGIRLIVGLVTGWMSGRMHMPEAFQGKGLLTDPLVIRWQIRFVRYMVRRFKDHPAIAAWDLGNECNCMQGISHDAAYLWASAITNTIRAEDKAHPVVSGMHGLSPTGTWSPEDQGEILDILCTHPYPLFTPYCGTDPLNEMKSILHSTAESVLYASLGGKPCFVEEAGTLGPMIADEDIAADYIRACLFSTWAHDLRGFVWWCANEQELLTHTPYDWDAVERELGLFRTDGSPKPVVGAMKEFADFADSFSAGVTGKDGAVGNTLPTYLQDAVCILTAGQDLWATAYGAFILGKQAGLDITYAWCQDEIPASPVYMLPNLCGLAAIEGHVLSEILRRVENGATLYVSLGNALMSPFSSYTGVKVKTRCQRTRGDRVTFADGTTADMWSEIKYQYEVTTAKVLAYTDDGNPALTVNEYGRGKVYFCAYPIESDAGTQAGIVSGEGARDLYRFYAACDLRNSEKTAKSDSPYVCVTEHIKSENERILTVMNYRPEEGTAHITCDGYSVSEVLTIHGGAVTPTDDGFDVSLPGDTGLVVVVRA